MYLKITFIFLVLHLSMPRQLSSFFCKMDFVFVGIELSILPEAMPILALFLRKNQRALKLTTLQLIDCLLKNYHDNLSVQLLQPIIAEVPPLLDESDLHIAQWSLIILRSVAVYHPRALQDINNTIMPQVLTLVKSPLLQGEYEYVTFFLNLRCLKLF